MDIPVFNLKALKQYFYNFLAVALLILIPAIVFRYIILEGQALALFPKKVDWILITVLFAGVFLYDLKRKKELKKIVELSDWTEKFIQYESYFKKRLILNGVAILQSGFLLLTTPGNILLYIVIIQLILLPAFYPRKMIITRELKNDDIIFTE